MHRPSLPHGNSEQPPAYSNTKRNYMIATCPLMNLFRPIYIRYQQKPNLAVVSSYHNDSVKQGV
jgi:hypothetical protein